MLTGGRKWYPGFFQASHLQDFAAIAKVSPEQLLWNHSVFPYIAAFFDDSVYARVLSAALATGRLASKKGAATQSVSDYVPFRRYCLKCALEDEERWGGSYWHREHNLPGVLVCLRHQSVLRQTSLRTSGPGSWSNLLPREARGSLLIRSSPSRLDFQLAERAVSVLRRGIHQHRPRDSAWYRRELLRVGLISRERNVNAEKLAAFASATVGVHRARLNLPARDSDFHWLPLMVRPRTDFPFPTAKHLLFESILAQRNSAEPSTLDHVPSGPPPKKLNEFDAASARALRQLVHCRIKAHRKIRIADALKAIGCWEQFRHTRERFPILRKEIERFRVSEACFRPTRSIGPFAHPLKPPSRSKG